MPDETAPAPPPAAPPPAAGKAGLPKEPHPGGTIRAPGEGMSRQAKNPMPFVILVVLLCVGGWYLVSWMSDTTKLQDCVMAGRKNCTEMDPKLGR